MYGYPCDPSVRYPHPNSQQGNPFGNFQQNTYNTQRVANFHDYDKAFVSNTAMIDKVNFTNNKEVLHDNLNTNLLGEYIVEYTLNIDSYDRDTNTYLDPFHFVCNFGSVSGGIIRREQKTNTSSGIQESRIVEEYIKGTPMPYIAKKFNNVKYVKLECAMLPVYSDITYDAGSSTWKLDTNSNIVMDRFVVLKIKELESQKILSTGTTADGHGFVLIPSKIPYNSNFYYAIPPKVSPKVFEFKDSSLGTLDRFTIDFTDSFGTSLRYSNLDTAVPITDVRNPKNKYTQPYITFTIGVMENELKTDTNYDH